MTVAEFVESDVDPERTAEIDQCCHRWQSSPWWQFWDRSVRCVARCGAVLVGELAKEPPPHGMDWSRAVLVAPKELV